MSGVGVGVGVGAGAAATAAVASETSSSRPSRLLTVSHTRTRFPWSAAVSVYVVPVAPPITAQPPHDVAEVQRTHA